MKETKITNFEGFSFKNGIIRLAHAIKSIANADETNEIREQAYKQLYGCLRGLETLYDDDSFESIEEFQHIMPEPVPEKCVYLSESWNKECDIIQLLDNIIEAEPYFAPAYLLRAKIHQEYGNKKSFQKDFKEFVSLIPDTYKYYEGIDEYPLIARIFADNPANISKAFFDEAILYCSLAIEHFEAKLEYWPYIVRFCLYFFRYINFGLTSDFIKAKDDLNRSLVLHQNEFVMDYPFETVSAFATSEKPLDLWISYITSIQWKQLLLPIMENIDMDSDDYCVAYILLANIYLKLDKDEQSALNLLSDLKKILDKDHYFFEVYGENLEGLLDKTL
jgi:tetratricopeptide (TPR) repeat protein